MADTERLINKAQGDSIISAIQGITARLQEMYTVDDAMSSSSENPVQNKVVKAALDNKVDKVEGKGLSTNDYTNEDKASVANSAEQIASTQTATGNPITLTDCAPINAESLVVELEPKQDLHGQSAPYVGGAGKNKLPMTVEGLKTINTAGTWSGNVYTREGCTFEVLTDFDNNVVGIKVNAPSSHNTATFSFGDFTRISGTTYILNGCPANGSTSSYKLRWNDVGYDYGNGKTTDGTAGTGTVAIDIMSNTAVTNLIFYPMIRFATETDPTFAPYSNICPITGYTECEVDDVGKNLWEGGNISGTLRKAFDVDYPADVYSLSLAYATNDTASNQSLVSILYSDDTSDYHLFNRNARDSWSFIATKRITKIYFYASNNYVNSEGKTFTVSDIQFEKSATPTEYTPYHSSNATIQFGQTVYGGTLNFKTGILTVTGRCETFDGSGDENWTTSSSWTAGAYYLANALSDAISVSGYDTVADILSNLGEAQTPSSLANNTSVGVGQGNGSSLYVRFDNSLDTVEKLKTFLASNNLQICYELATQFTIQLTPKELKLLKQYNHISTNGTTINLGYQPDNVIGEVKGEIQAITEMPYLRILDNNVDTPINNYRIYYHLISGAYTLVNMGEMLNHRFIFVEVVQNPSGTANHTLLHSALIDPRTIDGFEYQMKASGNDTIWIESILDENKFSLSLRTTGGSYSDGDPTDYYVTIRMVD